MKTLVKSVLFVGAAVLSAGSFAGSMEDAGTPKNKVSLFGNYSNRLLKNLPQQLNCFIPEPESGGGRFSYSDIAYTGR